MLRGTGPALDALLTRAARTRLEQAASALALPARTVCLECRLDDDERVDLALCLAARTAHMVPALEALGQRHTSSPAWQRCIQLLLRWAKPEEPILGAMPFLFTAFDLQGELPALPVPCLSLCADPSFFMRRLGLPVPRSSPEGPLRLLDACMETLELEGALAPLRERARACLNAVEDTEVRHLSLMLARDPVSVKLDLTLPMDQVETLHSVMGRSDSARAITERLRSLAPWQRRVQLNYLLHAPGQAPPPLEIELCCTGADEGTVEQRAHLLQQLVSIGLASTSKVAALRALLAEPAVFDGLGQWVSRNWYLKLRFDAGRPVSAKAYIGLAQRSQPAPPAR
jgi:hypothetical protein